AVDFYPHKTRDAAGLVFVGRAKLWLYSAEIGCTTAIFFLGGEITVKRNAFYFVVTLAAVSVLFLTACNKKAAKVVPPAAPAPTSPTATLTASPDVIQQGQSTTLTWSTSNASSISIEGDR